MGEKYIILIGSEDGSCMVRGGLSKQAVLETLLSNEREDDNCRRILLDEVPLGAFHPQDMVIIRGEVIIPKVKVVVTEYEL